MKTLLSVCWSSLLRRRMTSLLIILAIACATTFISIGCFMHSTIQSVLVRQIEEVFAYHFMVADPSRDMTEALSGDARLQTVGMTTSFGDIMANAGQLQCLVFENDVAVNSLYGLNLLEGREPTNANEVALDLAALSALTQHTDPHNGLGTSITLTVSESNTGLDITSKPLLITGIYQNAKLRTMQNQAIVMLGSGGISTLDATFDSSTSRYLACRAYSVDDLDDIIDKYGIPKDKLQRNDTLIAAQRNVGGQNSLLLLITVVIAVLLFVAGMVIYNIFHMSMNDRIMQWSMIRAIGATQRNVLGMALIEGVLLCTVAIPLGWILSFALSSFIVPSAILAIDPESAFSLVGNTSTLSKNLQINPSALIISGISAFVVTMISIYSPARRAARTSPLESMRVYHQVTMNKAHKAKEFKSLAMKLASDSRKRYARQTVMSVATLAVVICLSASISLLFSANDLYKNVEHRIHGDYEIYNSERNTTSNIIPESVVSSIRQLEGVEAVATNRAGWYYEQDIGLVSSDEYLKGDLDVAEPVDERLINRDLACIYTLEIPDRTSTEWSVAVRRIPKVGDRLRIGNGYVEVVAVDLVDTTEPEYSSEDYYSTVTIADSTYDKLFPEENAYSSVYLNVKKEFSDREGLDQELRSLLDPYRGVCYLMSLEDTLDQIRLEQARFFALFYGFIAILGFVSLLSITNNIYTGFIQRQSEFAILCALGAARKKIRDSLIIEALSYAWISCICALPFALVVKYVFTGFAGMFQFLGIYFGISTVVGCACVIACLPTMGKLRQFSIVQSIEKVE